MMQFKFDVDPVAKGRPRFSDRNGVVRTHTPAKTLKFEKMLAAMAKHQMIKQGEQIKSCPVILDVRFVFSPPDSWPNWKRKAAIDGKLRHTGKPDVDNLVKGLKDALNGIAWHDDSQVSSLMATKRYGEESCIIATITESSGHCARSVKRSDIE